MSAAARHRRVRASGLTMVEEGHPYAVDILRLAPADTTGPATGG